MEDMLGPVQIPRVNTFSVDRRNFGGGWSGDTITVIGMRPVLVICFSEPFAEGNKGDRQRQAIARALMGPAGEENDRFDTPTFTEVSVEMGFPNIWSLKAGLDRVFWLYL